MYDAQKVFDMFHENFIILAYRYTLCDLFFIIKPEVSESVVLEAFSRRAYNNQKKSWSNTLDYMMDDLSDSDYDFSILVNSPIPTKELKDIVDSAVSDYVLCKGDVNNLSVDKRLSIELLYETCIKDAIANVKSYVPKQEAKNERQKLTLKMRYKVLERDNHRCCICGATSLTTELVVDHIIPVSRGGKTIMSNLQTLCFECNNGKSDDLDVNLIKEVEANG